MEHNAILKALKSQGIQDQHIKIIKQINNNTTTQIKLFNRPIEINIERGVRQGDSISPNLFTSTLENILRQANFKEGDGITIDGEELLYLAFADDIILFSNNETSIERMLGEINRVSERVGLKIHTGKTQWMTNQSKDSNITLNGNKITQVEEYKYLGQIITPTGDLQKEINNRIKCGWAAFKKIETVLTSKNVSKPIKAHLFNSNVLPALTYAAETWNTTARVEKKLLTTQRAMERRITNISKREHIRSDVIRQKTGVEDIITTVYKNKKRWAGHIARLPDNRWTTKTTNWYPYDRKRKKGRPSIRWEDPLMATYGNTWSRLAQDRKSWREDGDLHVWRDAA